MLIQNLIDFLAMFLADWISLLPALPPEWAELIGMLSNGAAWFGSTLGVLSPIVPFPALGVIIQVWVGLWSLWGVLLIVRVILWAFGR